MEAIAASKIKLLVFKWNNCLIIDEDILVFLGLADS